MNDEDKRQGIDQESPDPQQQILPLGEEFEEHVFPRKTIEQLELL